MILLKKKKKGNLTEHVFPDEKEKKNKITTFD